MVAVLNSKDETSIIQHDVADGIWKYKMMLKNALAPALLGNYSIGRLPPEDVQTVASNLHQ